MSCGRVDSKPLTHVDTLFYAGLWCGEGKLVEFNPDFLAHGSVLNH